jgi:hypothetical protein
VRIGLAWQMLCTGRKGIGESFFSSTRDDVSSCCERGLCTGRFADVGIASSMRIKESMVSTSLRKLHGRSTLTWHLQMVRPCYMVWMGLRMVTSMRSWCSEMGMYHGWLHLSRTRVMSSFRQASTATFQRSSYEDIAYTGHFYERIYSMLLWTIYRRCAATDYSC